MINIWKKRMRIVAYCHLLSFFVLYHDQPHPLPHHSCSLVHFWNNFFWKIDFSHDKYREIKWEYLRKNHWTLFLTLNDPDHPWIWMHWKDNNFKDAMYYCDCDCNVILEMNIEGITKGFSKKIIVWGFPCVTLYYLK